MEIELELGLGMIFVGLGVAILGMMVVLFESLAMPSISIIPLLTLAYFMLIYLMNEIKGYLGEEFPWLLWRLLLPQ